MLQTAPTARLAIRFAAAGMPLLPQSSLIETAASDHVVLVGTPRGEVAFSILVQGPACVAGTLVAGAVVPLIGLPSVVLDLDTSRTIDVALLALLSVLTPVTAGRYVSTLEEIAAVERASVRRFGQLGGRVRPALLTWEDALGAVNGRPLRAARLARRQLLYVRRRFWSRLGAGVRSERRERRRLRPPTVWPREFR